MATEDDPFRFCVHCGADCYDPDSEHAAACPQATGVYTVTAKETQPCPHCGKPTMVACCYDCGCELLPGASYMRVPWEDDMAPALPGTPPPMSVSTVVCVGCAAHRQGAGDGD